MFIVSKSPWLTLGRSDTIGYQVFDKKGNLIYDRQRFHQITYEYDTNGWLKKKLYDTDISARYTISYQYDADKRLLYQFWNLLCANTCRDTCIFGFNADGRLIKATEFAHEGYSDGTNAYTTQNEYDNTGKLIKRIGDNTERGMDYLWGREVWEEYFSSFSYSGNRLDSTVSIISSHFHPWTATSKTFYNPNGLCDSTVIIDTLINHSVINPMTDWTYVWDSTQVRDTIVTHYHYKSRND